jgi:peptide/nickel transport system ATP-binding protein
MPPLLSIHNLTIAFRTESGLTPGVEGINLEVRRGEIVALAGESGSGKSITALSILQLLQTPPAVLVSGEIFFTGGGHPPIDLLLQSPRQMQHIRGSGIAMIFQEPMTSLNPVFTCGHQVMEAIRAHRKVSASRAREETLLLFEKVKLPDPSSLLSRYPHELSGGQKQRVMIAMAMSGRPSLLICDEPTTALDVTVQKTILGLINDLRKTEKWGVIFITHDLGVVAEIADRVLVLYKGKVVEEGSVDALFHHPRHPYTKGLLNCRPALHAKGERLPVVSDFMAVDEKGEMQERGVPEPGKKDPACFEEREDRTRNRDLIAKPLLVQVQNVSVWYPGRRSFASKAQETIKAVDGVSFDVYRGETLGWVGE